MALTCGQLTSGLIAATCGKAPSSGTGAKVFLMNYADIDKKNSTVENGVISSIVLHSGKTAYEFESMPKSTLGEATFARGTYFNTFDHAVTLRVFTKNAESKAFMSNLANSRIVAIVENADFGTNGEVKYEVYGWDSGLTLSELSFSTTYSDSTVYAAKMASEDESKEGALPHSFFDTDIDTTEQALQSLKSTL